LNGACNRNFHFRISYQARINALVGGFENSIALQPITIEGQNGLNVAAGVAALNLHFDKAKPAKVS
jgi:hypothetical protein